MHLRIIREPSTLGTTFGSLYVNGHWLCWTLEDQIREPQTRPAAIPVAEWVATWKVTHQTAIPSGTYRVRLSKSNRFGIVTPELLDVPGFEGIRIHSGNSIGDTSGCPLVGLDRTEETVTRSRVAFAKLMGILERVPSTEYSWLLIQQPVYDEVHV